MKSNILWKVDCKEQGKWHLLRGAIEWAILFPTKPKSYWNTSCSSSSRDSKSAPKYAAIG